MRLKDTIHDRLGLQLLNFVGLLIILYYSQRNLAADWREVLDNRQQFQLFLSSFMNPDWAYFPKLIDPVIDTLAMAVVGTFLGSILAIPIAFLATPMVSQMLALSVIIRSIFAVIRTIPNLLLAALFVAIIGIGPATGVFTITVFTFGMVSQLIYGSIETLDARTLEADQAVGASRMQIACNSVWPQVEHDIYSYCLYAFEVNIRASAILGYVGAGGLGVVLQTNLGFFKYDRVSLIILVVLLIVLLTDGLSYYLRKEVL
ncbi:phosphonate ABC transporter, permease protein PhnE [Ignavigranum ruoffiae]|uniref:Phosphonate transport system permease protein n=1 Tax=Ignavigranum ruoffiae TaxID=89093 RepID=A0A1H9AZX1_9LACT|nr:phosphonate ABC transporter, permease protein PhnE [Ignavigranum ruoffiae]SEP82332.1 phosphonate transport system permease protein [Ignavigranum ruoffiae]